jgi:hypothetical protein
MRLLAICLAFANKLVVALLSPGGCTSKRFPNVLTLTCRAALRRQQRKGITAAAAAAESYVNCNMLTSKTTRGLHGVETMASLISVQDGQC